MQTTGLGSCFGTRALGLVLFGRSFRGSCFRSCFSWFVLLVRAFGGSYVFFFDALKFLEACVARSEVS